MKKAVISVLVGTAVLAFVACGKCCNGKQFRFGCFNGIGILAGGKWTESNPCEPGNKFVSWVTEKYHIRWREQLGQDTSFGDASFGDTSFRRAS